MDISIDIEGFESWKAVWQKAPELTRRELLAATWDAELLLKREITELTPSAVTGLLKNSIAAQEPLVLGDQVLGEVGTSISYAVPVELGTKPHFPPVEALMDWVRTQWKVADKDIERAAFKLASIIAVRGTAGKGMFKEGFGANVEQIKGMYRQAHRNIIEGIRK